MSEVASRDPVDAAAALPVADPAADEAPIDEATESEPKPLRLSTARPAAQTPFDPAPPALEFAVATVTSPLAARGPLDLLAPLGRTRRHLPALLFSARALNLAVMLALIVFGLGVADEAMRFTNITSFLVWNIWWPFLIVAVFFAARLWCGVCHLRLTADVFDRFGLKLKVPRVVKRYGTTVPLFTGLGIFLVHSLVVSYDIHHFASLTALFLIGLMAYAVAVALLFEKHSFCKYFCPIVGVLGNYTRVSPTELRSSDLDQCRRCRDKECVRNCQNRLYMGTMDDEQQESCLLCMRCVKHCPHDNIRFSLRPYLSGLWRSPKRTIAGTFAVVVLLGIVMGEVGEEWAVVDGWLLAVPAALADLTGVERVLATTSGTGFLIWETLWVFVVLPLLILAVCGGVASLLAGRHKPLEYVQVYALGFVPLILSLHAAKLVTAFNDRVLYLPHAVVDPGGAGTVAAIAAGTVAAPGALVSSPALWGWLTLAFVLGFGVLGSLYATFRIARVNFAGEGEGGVGIRTAIPFSVVIAALGIIALLTIHSWRIAGGGG
jgi:polyferredoxin